MTENGVLEFVREDDFVEYFLFPESKVVDNREEELMINSVLREAKSLAKKYTGEYLWHRDEFDLSARTSVSNILSNEEDRDNLPPHLHGITHYGDNIEDEWFIVYLLVQLTKNIEGLVVRIADVDGEFLLIEAAEQLPNWARPENCDKRVYLFKGLLHIVAPEASENSNEAPEITVDEALREIRRNPSLTVASPQIQEAIQKKINGYPGKIQENLHHATAYLPVCIAAILQHNRNLVAPAIQAFCNRDSVDMRACRAMKFFPPENRVRASVTFTKCLYAMLNHSRYLPDRKTGWNLPQPNSADYKAHLLGIKIACGFEILISQAKPTLGVEGDKGWHTYLNSLKVKEYFRGLLEGSQEYNNLLNKAKEYYIKHRDSMQVAPGVGREILDLTKSLDYNFEDLKKAEVSLPTDDSEDWLNVSPEDLDKMLTERYGKSSRMNGTDPNNFSKKITKFLEHISDVEGAEFPQDEDNMPPSRPPRNKERKQPTNNINDGKVNFDANSFSCAVQNILSFVIPEDDSWDLDSDSDMDDYGKEEEAPMDYGELKNKMEEYMKQMDAELAGTTIGKSFEKRKEETFDDIESFKPVDIDMNALKNILESYKSQMGEAGPSSNMLGPMGVHLEKFDENPDSD